MRTVVVCVLFAGFAAVALGAANKCGDGCQTKDDCDGVSGCPNCIPGFGCSPAKKCGDICEFDNECNDECDKCVGGSGNPKHCIKTLPCHAPCGGINLNFTQCPDSCPLCHENPPPLAGSSAGRSISSSSGNATCQPIGKDACGRGCWGDSDCDGTCSYCGSNGDESICVPPSNACGGRCSSNNDCPNECDTCVGGSCANTCSGTCWSQQDCSDACECHDGKCVSNLIKSKTIPRK